MICEWYEKDYCNNVGSPYCRGICKRENTVKGENIVKLPCKVNDNIYLIYPSEDGESEYVAKAQVMGFFIDAFGGVFDLMVTTDKEIYGGYKKEVNQEYTFEDIGKTVFFTEEEAKKKMKTCK